MITILQDADGPGPLELIQTAPVASFIFVLTIGISIWAFYSDEVYDNMILHPYSVARGRRLYTLITSGLIHLDIIHLAFNMLSFYFFAFTLEAGSKAVNFAGLGHWQFGFLYVGSLILSDLPSVYKYRNADWYHSLGASGAIAAVIFSFVLFFPVTGGISLLFLPIPLPPVVFGMGYLFYCNYMAKHSRDNVNHDAHFFGAFSGILITIILDWQVAPDFITKVSGWIQSFFHH